MRVFFLNRLLFGVLTNSPGKKGYLLEEGTIRVIYMPGCYNRMNVVKKNPRELYFHGSEMFNYGERNTISHFSMFLDSCREDLTFASLLVF